ncbi:hypothetical protein AAEQ26_004628 [Enterobacter hormaechei]
MPQASSQQAQEGKLRDKQRGHWQHQQPEDGGVVQPLRQIKGHPHHAG